MSITTGRQVRRTRKGIGASATLLACAVAGALLVQTGVASSAESSVVASSSVTTRIVWRGCGERLQCARVQVPLDWARPGLGTISLAVVRYLTISAHDGITEITGPITDPAHLQGLLERIAGLGLMLHSVAPLNTESSESAPIRSQKSDRR